MASSSVLRKLRGVFQENKPNKLPETWFRPIFLTENHYTGIEIVASSEKMSRVKACQLILNLGFKVYYANKLQEHNEEKQHRAETNVKQYPTRFIRALKKNAKPEDKKILKNL